MTVNIELSVVMPVHNARPYVDAAIQSILDQSFTAFEFVIFDDGSTDGTRERLRDWAARDGRIRLIESERNLGPVGSSNAVAREARAPLIARMDADDVSHPRRLELQVAALAARPDIGLVGTLCNSIDARGARLRGPDLWRLAGRSGHAPFPHGSIMYRREIFEAIGGYRKQCEFWEDQDLVIRAARVAKVATLPLALYEYRHSPVSTRLSSDNRRVERACDLNCRAVRMLQTHGSYESLLHPGAELPARVDPRVFVALGSLVLWGGDRPRLFAALLRRAGLRADLITLTAMAWTLWAALEPRSLRLVMKGLAAARNRLASPARADLIEWAGPFAQEHRAEPRPERIGPLAWQPAAE